MRVLLFTGKGGVGKTTVAAATALACAASGMKTVVVSTDPAHSLADALESPLDSTPRQVSDRTWGVQLDATERMEEAWGELRSYLVDVFDWAGLDAVEAEELAVLPGLEELFALAEIESLAASGDYDVVVVDCAPTAETLRLLSLPTVLSWYMDRVFPVSRRVTRLLRPVVGAVSAVPVAGDDVFRAGERLYHRLQGARRLLADQDTTSIRLVVNPERMVVAEARRTVTYLSLFGYGIDSVIANRILPDSVGDPWFDGWKSTQAAHMATIRESFHPAPVLTATLSPSEVTGIDALGQFGAHLYDGRDPSASFHRGPTLAVDAAGPERILRLPLPLVDKDELEVGRRGDELIVRVGPYRRSVCLPDSLRLRPVAGAAIVADDLEVRFGPAVAGAGGSR
ncbi:MAG TPA: ArsA family ATPase [Acidimicrobiales bacterium]|nr:ArsA family ATPase [Acidimicrobiales bacterium]